MLVDGLEDRVGVEFGIAHHLGEHVPFDLSEGEKNVLVRQQRVLTPAGFFDATVDDPLGGLRDLAGRDVEVVYVHGCCPPIRKTASCTPSGNRGRTATVRRFGRNGAAETGW